MAENELKEMLEAGVHFGHKTDKWNPKMKRFIYTERNGVHIFDLAKTQQKLEEAVKFVSNLSKEGGTVLFVGTKNQVKGVVKQAAEKSGSPFLVDRWPGGVLTNFNTILGRLKYMKESEEKVDAGKGMTKKEALNLKRELEKLNATFEGVKDINKLPDALFVVDLSKERTAIREAKILGIPVIGIADTNVEPNIEYPIPGNDDAVRAVEYISNKIAEAISANKKQVGSETETQAPVIEEQTEDKSEEETVDKELENKEMDWEEEAVVKKSKPSEEPVAEEKSNK